MAVGRPVLLLNPTLAPLIRDLPVSLWFPQMVAQALASRIGVLSRADASLINLVGGPLRKREEQEHSLDHWSKELSELLRRWSRGEVHGE
jgi:hypothetical protein